VSTETAVASLVHRRPIVTLPSDAPLSRDRATARTSNVLPGDVVEATARSLRRQAPDLAARWTAQARTVLLLDRADDQEPADVGGAEGLVDVLLSGFDSDDRGSEDATGHGMRLGASAFARGVSLHHMMKALDLLVAMTLYAVEATLERDAVPHATAVVGVRLARRLQRRAALLSLAASRGYLQAFADAVRDHFRHLRHDLRNPLGTIKSVLALMDDESVPLEARVNPSFRAMATRNARALEELIADRLSDAAALLPVVAGQEVSVRAIACAVRRELRTEADRCGVTILVEQGGPHGRLDAAGLELLLRDALHAALRESESGEQLRIDFEQLPGRTTVLVACESGRPPIQDPEALQRLATLARQIGATITASERLLLSMQFRPSDSALAVGERERAVPRASTGLDDGEARDDVGSARESDHGKTGAH
jgi:signal transduction histidine kinase